MNLYTAVLDFRGGTYISQFDAETPLDAVTAWCHELEENDLLGEASDRVAEGILVDAIENGLVEVDGLHGAWCAAATVEDHMALLNLIITQRLD